MTLSWQDYIRKKINTCELTYTIFSILKVVTKVHSLSINWPELAKTTTGNSDGHILELIDYISVILAHSLRIGHTQKSQP